MGNYKSNQKPPKRTSFTLEKSSKDGSEFFKGWMSTKQFGFYEVVAFAKDGKVKKDSSGNEYIQMVVTFKNKWMINKETTSGMWYEKEGKMRVPEYDIVCTLKGSGTTSNGKHAKGAIIRINKNQN